MVENKEYASFIKDRITFILGEEDEMLIGYYTNNPFICVQGRTIKEVKQKLNELNSKNSE